MSGYLWDRTLDSSGTAESIVTLLKQKTQLQINIVV